MTEFSIDAYNKEISELFASHPSFQTVGAGAYKPGLERVELYSSLHGQPHKKYKTIHVAGTNGKGTVCSMVAAALASEGYKVGLYTSPHIESFTERIKVVESTGYHEVSREWVYEYLIGHKEEFHNFGFSFFEITTMMAFEYFEACGVDYAVIEVGLGGRLDATNIITPAVSVITSIGLDHMEQLGDSLGEIAFEKAGIIKKGVPVVIGEGSAEINPVFENKVKYVNDCMPGVLLHWAHAELETGVVERDFRTAGEVLQVLGIQALIPGNFREMTGLSCRFQKVSREPLIIKDLGHNAAALKYSFAELSRLHAEEGYDLIIIYAKAKDKDFAPIVDLMPSGATYIFTQADGPRATPAGDLAAAFQNSKPGAAQAVYMFSDRQEAYEKAMSLASETHKPLIYIGGSTYILDITV